MLEVGDVRKFPDLFCRSLAMNCSFIFYHQRIYSPSSCSVDLILQGIHQDLSCIHQTINLLCCQSFPLDRSCWCKVETGKG